MIFSILLFAAVGFAFGYAFGGPVAWIVALGLPTLVALATVAGDGFDDFNFVAFVVTLLLSGFGVIVGALLRRRGEQRPREA
ncbi:MAG: hypothetical protein WD844_08170 [Thermoleophilaceae bacterium]